MKIILSNSEIISLSNVMDTIQEGATEELTKVISESKLIDVVVENEYTTISIDKDYTEEFFSVYEKYIALFVNQIKAFFESVNLFANEIDSVVCKHMSKTIIKEGEE